MNVGRPKGIGLCNRAAKKTDHQGIVGRMKQAGIARLIAAFVDLPRRMVIGNPTHIHEPLKLETRLVRAIWIGWRRRSPSGERLGVVRRRLFAAEIVDVTEIGTELKPGGAER